MVVIVSDQLLLLHVLESVSSLAKKKNRNWKEIIIVRSSGDEEMKEQKGMKLWTI